jgi:hypothetical protein
MLLTGGARLGPDEITAQMGTGRMDEVYRAKVTKLGREVAIRLLLEEFGRVPLQTQQIF